MSTLQRTRRAAREVPFRRVEQPLGTELSFQRKLHRLLVAAAIIGPVALAPELSSARASADPLKTNPAQIASAMSCSGYVLEPDKCPYAVSGWT